MASSEDKALILVAEDDQMMAEGIADILSVERYRVETAFSGRAAGRRAAADAALADLRTSILTALSHEFRTPLTYITGYGQMLADDGQEMNKDSFQRCVTALLHGTERLRRLVENVLLFSQIDSGEAAALIKMFPLQTTELREIAHDVIKVHQLDADARQVRVHNSGTTVKVRVPIANESSSVT